MLAATSSLLALALAFGYPDDIFFTGIRIVPMRCGCDLVWTPPTRPVLLLRGVAATDAHARSSARRAVRSARRELAGCRPDGLRWTENLEIGVVLPQRATRARIATPGHIDADAIACVERVLQRAPWSSSDEGEVRVYLRWSVVTTTHG